MKIIRTCRAIGGVFLAVIPGVIFLYIPVLLKNNQAISEEYARNFFPWISKPIEFISSHIPISLTEVLVVFSALTSLLWIIWLIYAFVHSKDKRRYAYRFLVISGALFSVIAISFTLMLGINYTRIPLEDTLSLTSPQRSPAELAEVTSWIADMMTKTRSVQSEDSAGCMVLQTSLSETLSDASRAMDAAAIKFPVLEGNAVLPKPVALSHYWSYTGITGMYFPFFGEANVNVDVPDSQLPMTACHEVSHTRGIAREQDANLAGFLACIFSSRTDFQYSAYQFAYIYCANDLYYTDKNAYSLINDQIPDSVRRDFTENAEYWDQFKGPVQETSTKINDTYLQANQQTEGVRSYDRVTDLIINYYFTYVKGK